LPKGELVKKPKKQPPAKPIVLAIVSDVHAGSTTSVCCPEGTRLEDGGEYRPNRLQLYLWHLWAEKFWPTVDALRTQHNADLGVIVNGDAVEGSHHGTTQVASHNLEAQSYIAGRVFGIIKDMKPRWVWLSRGTAAHVGQGAAAEEALARSLGAERTEDGLWTNYVWRLNLHNVLIDVRHHGRSSSRPWLTGSAAGILASEIWHRHVKNGERPPDLAFRAHKHGHFDSHKLAPTRCIMTPSWQGHTGHAHKVVAETFAEFGGVAVVIQPDGTYDVKDILFHPKQSEPWRP
jgi:hypothetical protein